MSDTLEQEQFYGFCKVVKTSGGKIVIIPDEKDALRAAAPEMLEALKRILPSAIAYEMDNSDHFDEDGRIAFAQAAIAKAEGRQP